MSELVTAMEWIQATLSDDETLSDTHSISEVYVGAAPSDAAYPCIIVANYTPGRDLAFNNAQRLWSDPTFLVKVVDRAATFTGLEGPADRVDALLHRQSNGGDVLSCVREEPFSFVEFDEQENQHYRHLGGIYRVQVK
jgi:hypothetical protein